MEGQRLILNNGTIIEDGSAGYFCGFLWCYFKGMTLMQVSELFLNPANTARIVFQYGDNEETYTGFTVCREMSIDADGNNSVCMAKGGS